MLAEMPKVWLRDIDIRNLETFLFRNSSWVREHIGYEMPRVPDFPEVPAQCASLRSTSRSMSRPYNLTKVRGRDHPVVLQMSCIGTPARKALDIPCRMSSDFHRQGELRGLIGSVDSIHNPLTEGLLCSRLRGIVAY